MANKYNLVYGFSDRFPNHVAEKTHRRTRGGASANASC
jgi:hypothetical protein